MYKRTILSNGIKVITEEIPFFKSASIGIWINSGSKDEREEKTGISHFVEHMMFKGTNRYNAREIAEIMDSVGGQLNAFTEKEQTCYYVRVIDRHVPLALDLLADMLLNSTFDSEELERERNVIREEICMYEDSPEDIIFDIFTQALWDGHPLGRPIMGTETVINSLTRDDLNSHVKERYVGENIIIAAAGNITHEDMVSLVESLFKTVEKGSGRARVAEKIPFHNKREIIRHKDCEQMYVILGGMGISQQDDDKYKVMILDSILGGSMSSRLFQEIREKRGLVYSVSSFQNSYYDAGLFGIFACTSAENLDSVISLSFQGVKEIKETSVNEQELLRAKEQLKGTISLALESTSNRMIRLAKSEIYHGRLVPHEEVFEKLDAVTADDIDAISRVVLDWENYGISVLGQVEEGYALKRNGQVL
jgi:predicted Zn-dependent peptidase